MTQELSNRWALVTGASSGLGLDFAKELAARGANLVLVARREDRLNEAAAEIRKQHQVEVDVVVMDLGTREGPAALHREVTEVRGRAIDILINNAGFGLYGSAVDLPWERERAMIELDILTLVDLSKRFAKDMRQRGFGRILQVASIGAYQSTPTYAAYSAAKAFVLSYGEALNYELRKSGVSCTVISPGITATEFLAVSGQKATLYQRIFMMQSKDVTRIGIRAMLAGRSSIVPGFMNALTAWSIRFMPRNLATAIAYQSMKQPGDTIKALQARV
jgi:short-subunit dehydrogenase